MRSSARLRRALASSTASALSTDSHVQLQFHTQARWTNLRPASAAGAWQASTVAKLAKGCTHAE